MFDPEEMRRFIAMAVGEASMCWENPWRGGIFDSVEATAIVDRLFDRFELHQDRIV